MKKWIRREPLPEEAQQELSGYPEFIRPLLFYRGVKNKSSADIFLNPDYKIGLHDPFAILNMEKAVEKILSAVKSNERVVVFSDYDADGVTAAVVFDEFFKKIGFENYHIHIGARKTEGYGLNMNVVEEFIGQKAALVITLDCGISDYDEVEALNKANIEVIIIDHHLVPEKPPRAYAIVNSKQPEDTYPFRDLCGAAAAFKTIDAMVKRGGLKITEGWEKWLLDLVAIASVADMVPLVGENRILTFYGLQVLRKTRRVGLLAMFKRANLIAKEINEDDIAFTIGPRINISSRMGHASASFDLLVTESHQEGDWISGRLDQMSGDRRTAVDEIMDEAGKRFKGGEKVPGIIVLGDEKWNPGVLGLAAMRIVEKYKSSAFVWGRGEAEEIKGSCRGDGTVSLVELMRGAPEGVFINIGGHMMAGGFSALPEKINGLEQELNNVYEKMPKMESELDNVYIDEEVSLDDVNWGNYAELDKLRPFGMGNPKPNFLFAGVVLNGVKKFGNGKAHLQLDFKNSKNQTISAIGFFIGADEHFNVIAGQTIDLVANIEKNTFRGANELRLRIVDIAVVG